MIVKIVMDSRKGIKEFEADVARFSIQENMRVIMLHNHDGTIDAYNMDRIESFNIPLEAIKGIH